MNISGVTVFRGLEGYGETGEMHGRHLAGSDRPMVVVIVETDERVRNSVPVFEGMITTGVIAMSDVEMIRVRKGITA
jgi:PII-like signaling protein